MEWIYSTCKILTYSQLNQTKIMSEFSLIAPDDWHLHVRDGDLLSTVINHTAHTFKRAVIMPNLNPPVTTVTRALQYRDEILAAVDEQYEFQPLMSLYLTDNTTEADVTEAAAHPSIIGFKLYPSGATTNSDAGVTRISSLMGVLEKMAELGVVLQIHGEVTDPHVDIFDREAVFIDQVLDPIHRELPELKIVLEHITTSHGIDFVNSATRHVGGTLTAHHLLYNRNELFRGGLRPHYYCLPVLKREEHRRALVEAAISGSDRFFLGTDSAPHTQHAKESACGCAGCYTAHAGLELYARAFEHMEALSKLEHFASIAGPKFYGLPVNKTRITLKQEAWQVPSHFATAQGEHIIPLLADESMVWRATRS